MTKFAATRSYQKTIDTIINWSDPDAAQQLAAQRGELKDDDDNTLSIEVSGNRQNYRAVRTNPDGDPIEQGGWFRNSREARDEAVEMSRKPIRRYHAFGKTWSEYYAEADADLRARSAYYSNALGEASARMAASLATD